MKIIFMGTPDFAVGTLEALTEAGHRITLAVTQPDKPKGRGHSVQYTPVKEAAVRLGIPVYQPQKIRSEESVRYLESIEADVIVVVAFGQMIPKSILEMKKYGCINVHASLLPKYRGTTTFVSISPVSSPSSICMIVTPDSFSPLITAH